MRQTLKNGYSDRQAKQAMAKEEIGFVFLPSYWNAAKTLNDEIRHEFVEMVIEYGLTGNEEILKSDIAGVAGMLYLIKPIIDKGRKRYRASVENGAKGGRPPKTKNNLNKPNENQYKDKEKYIDIDTDNDIDNERFKKFWLAYPKKMGVKEARAAFYEENIDDATLDRIIKALEIQKQSESWKKENGQYIPRPSRYLSEWQWENVEIPIEDDGWQ